MFESTPISFCAGQILESLPDRAATHQTKLGAVPSAAAGGGAGGAGRCPEA